MDAENIDPSVRVQVLPSQNAYFAGETFSVTITFTNTRLPVNPSHVPDPATAPAPAQKSHRRNAHSISSAPLAKPPTSPGLGSRPPDIVKALGSGVGGGRKGLIGNGVDNGKGKGKEVLEARRSVLEKEKEKARSASVDITANGQGDYVQAYQLDPGQSIAVSLLVSRSSPLQPPIEPPSHSHNTTPTPASILSSTVTYN